MKKRKGLIALFASLGLVFSFIAFVAVSVIKVSNEFKGFEFSDEDFGWDI